MEDKKSLTSAEEREKIEGKASLSSAVDYYVSMQSDIFISASPGNMHNALVRCLPKFTVCLFFCNEHVPSSSFAMDKVRVNFPVWCDTSGGSSSLLQLEDDKTEHGTAGEAVPEQEH